MVDESLQADVLFAMTLDMLCVAGTDGYFKRVNPAFREALGWSSEELLSAPFLDFVHPDDVSATIAEVEKLAAGHPTIRFENRYRCKDGQYKWLLWTCRPDGATLYAAARDITDRKVQESLLQDFETMFSVSLELLCIAGPDGYFKRVNPAFTEVLGWSADELLAKPFVEFIHPEDVVATRAEVARINSGTPTISFENRYRCKDGSFKWLLWNSRPVGSKHYAAARDITQRKEAELRLRTRTRELELARDRLERDNVALLASQLQVQEFIKTGSSTAQVRRKNVLIADRDRDQLRLAEMGLRGTGVNLDVVYDEDDLVARLADQSYDLFLVTEDFLGHAAAYHARHPATRVVFMTPKKAGEFISVIRQNPFLANVVSREKDDRILNLKNVTVSVLKLLAKDIFGIDKYLNWGVDIRQLPIAGSEGRLDLLDELRHYLENLGCRSTLVTQGVAIADELTMNAIYDAPTDRAGLPRFNHLPRNARVLLEPHEQGRLSFGSDGMLLAIATDDPFGALKRETLLDYLERCYQVLAPQDDPLPLADTSQAGKGGGGNGLYQIMCRAALFAVSVAPGQRTEALAILNLDPEHRRSNSNGSFHFFYGAS